MVNLKVDLFNTAMAVFIIFDKERSILRKSSLDEVAQGRGRALDQICDNKIRWCKDKNEENITE